MSFEALPLSYCTNVHPALTVNQVLLGLQEFTVPVQAGFGQKVAAGLWLAHPVIQEILEQPAGILRFRDELRGLGLVCHSLNAFPYGDFHSERVKDQVYLPDWSMPERLKYTLNCAHLLAALLPEGGEGSISTLPLGFKEHVQPPDFNAKVIANLTDCAMFLSELRKETGKTIRLAIEPEPYCLLETTPETEAFFQRIYGSAGNAGTEQILREFLGVCYDVCHQAVEFEEIGDSIRSLERAGIRINKLHITCALQLDQPSENRDGREVLASYAEPRYLHQTIGKTAQGKTLRIVDLTTDFAMSPPGEWPAADCWRIHFHVPVNASEIGPLRTTRPQLVEALKSVASLDYAPHLEVETYTWGVLPKRVLPGGVSPEKRLSRTNEELIQGLTAEMRATRTLIDQIQHS